MKTSWTYEKAGVPHLKGDPAFNREIVRLIRSTPQRGLLGNPTGFAALFDPSAFRIQNPLLVSSTDGVGTKLEIAYLQRRHDSIGIDLVAMCVNDLITSGARPLFFLDYFATGKFDKRTTVEVLKGIVKGCRRAGCALVGGETAVMPGFYQASAANGSPQYDLAGFSVGVVDRRKVISGKGIRAGDLLLGLASSGFHSNGFSLLRKIFSKRELSGRIGKMLLTPTRIYVKPVLALLEKISLRGIVHITGGGFQDNIPRVLPAGLDARIDLRAWPRPKAFDLVRLSGNIPLSEMCHTFNMGIGMVLVLRRNDAPRAQKIIGKIKLKSWVIGEITPGNRKVRMEEG